MEPAPSDYKVIPTFGPNSSMASPDSTTLDVGYQSGETFPVTEGNWLFNGLSNNNNVSERLAKSVVNELDYLLTQNGITPNGAVNTQVNQAVNAAAATAVAAEATLARNANNLTSGTVALARIPNTLTGKDADTVDGYHVVQNGVGIVSCQYNFHGTLNNMVIGEIKFVSGDGLDDIILPALGNYFVFYMKSSFSCITLPGGSNLNVASYGPSYGGIIYRIS